MKKKIDIIYVFFLELLCDLKNNLGAPLAVRQLVRRAIAFSENLPRQDFQDKNFFWKALEEGDTILNLFEDKFEKQENNIITTPACPNENFIKNYFNLWKGIPNEYNEIMEEFNKPSTINKKLKIGCGSASNPFCVLYQPLRSIAISKISISGKPIEMVTLGCKSFDEKDFIAYEYLAEEGIEPRIVQPLLKNTNCVFLLKFT